MSTETLYAFRYLDGTIEFWFGKLTNSLKKDVISILMENMSLDKRREFEALSKDIQEDIVHILLDEKWLDNYITYEL